MSIKLGIVQYENSHRWDKNFEYAVKTIKHFSKKGVDIVCFQEAYMSGYGAYSMMMEFSYIEQFLEKIKELAYELDICVFIPSLIEKKLKIYNACYVFNHDKGDSTIYKYGLTPSETIMLTPKRSTRRFSLKGVDIGVLICREMQDKPYAYFDKKDLPQLLLWPSYWGWSYKDKWGEKTSDGKEDKTYSLIKALKLPLIQINMANTPLANGNMFKAGKSVIVNSDNKKVGVGSFSKVDRYIVEFKNSKLRKLR